MVRLLVVSTLCLLAFTPLAACGDDNGEEVGGGVATKPSEGGGETPQAGGAESQGARLEIAAENEEGFTKDELEAEAGTVTIVFENRDDGGTHNLAIYMSGHMSEEHSEEAHAMAMASTPIETGPATSELTVDLEPGDYVYRCDVHHAMRGALHVKES